MSKLDLQQKYRLEGMVFARKIMWEAKARGEDPVTALENEIKFRARTRVVVMATEKELMQASEPIKELTIKTMLAASIIVLWEQFGFGKTRAERFLNAFHTYVRALGEKSVTWFDITDTVRDMTGIEIDLSDANIAGKGENYG